MTIKEYENYDVCCGLPSSEQYCIHNRGDKEKAPCCFFCKDNNVCRQACCNDPTICDYAICKNMKPETIKDIRRK